MAHSAEDPGPGTTGHAGGPSAGGHRPWLPGAECRMHGHDPERHGKDPAHEPTSIVPRALFRLKLRHSTWPSS